MTGLEGETLAIGAVVIFGVKPVTDAVIALSREFRKPRGSRPTDTAGGAADAAPSAPAAPILVDRSEHTIEHRDEWWVCRCGFPLATRRAEARQVMQHHRRELLASTARPGMNGAMA